MWKGFFWGDEHALELNRGDGLHSIVNVLKATKFYTLKLLMINFMSCEFYNKKKKKEEEKEEKKERREGKIRENHRP